MSEVDCIIEIQSGSNQKLEIDYNYNRLRLDRILETSMGYPGNYGYIPNTLCQDGDAIDIIMPVDYTVPIGCVIKCRIIGVMIMEDEEGQDEKLIVMPSKKVDKRLAHINNINDLPSETLRKIEHFFQHYKDLSPGKFVKTGGFKDKDEALIYLRKSQHMYMTKHKSKSKPLTQSKSIKHSKRNENKK